MCRVSVDIFSLQQLMGMQIYRYCVGISPNLQRILPKLIDIVALWAETSYKAPQYLRLLVVWGIQQELHIELVWDIVYNFTRLNGFRSLTTRAEPV